MKAAALCAGYGGLELGMRLAGWPVDLDWVAEIDPHAAQVLDARFGVPNLGDLTTITNPPPVDIMAAGFPCQPVSTAGKRKGIHDERWIIDDVARVARAAGVRRLILENVPGLLTANDGDAMAGTVAALAHNGFVARWTCVRAADVGAPHGRLRWFCVAAADTGGERQIRRPDVDRDGGQTAERRETIRDPRHGGPPHAATDPGGVQPERRGGPGAVASPPGTSQGDRGQRQRHGDTPSDRRPTAADPHYIGCSRTVTTPDAAAWALGRHACVDFGPYQAAIDQWARITGRPAPRPTDDRGRLNPRFVEWMMGLPDGWVTDIIPQRSHALRILGNGVVPQQAAHALRLLTEAPR